MDHDSDRGPDDALTHTPAPPAQAEAARSDAGPLGPISAGERIGSLDVLRGVALLGILLMNIMTFAFPMAMYMNPLAMGEISTAERVQWFLNQVLFEQKMMTIFSLLFGAGVIVMTSRAAHKAGSTLWLHLRRMWWLLVIGLLHAYFIWFGDILVAYALCGALVYPLRKLRPRTLLIIGAGLVLISVAIAAVQGVGMQWMRGQVEAGQAAIDRGEEPTPMQANMIEQWDEMTAMFDPTPEQLEEDIAAHRGAYADHLPLRAEMALMFQTQMFLTWTLWRVGGLMVIGMALMKLGVLSLHRSRGFYIKMMLVSYAIGLPLSTWAVWRMWEDGFDPVPLFMVAMPVNGVASVAMALGHIALVMLICQAGALTAARHALSAVGRMAFTNYLMQSVICTLIFYGHGLGMYAKLDRIEALGVVLLVWAAQLVWSPLWLARFRFGPMEWLWRSLTYMRPQPMRLAPTS